MRTILIMTVLLLTSCSTVKKTKETRDETQTTVQVAQSEKQEIQSVQISNKETTQTAEIEAETEIDKPFEISKIENGRVVETFKVTGNAKINIKRNQTATNSATNTATVHKEQRDSLSVQHTKVDAKIVKKEKKDIPLWLSVTAIVIFLIGGLIVSFLYFINKKRFL